MKPYQFTRSGLRTLKSFIDKGTTFSVLDIQLSATAFFEPSGLDSTPNEQRDKAFVHLLTQRLKHHAYTDSLAWIQRPQSPAIRLHLFQRIVVTELQLSEAQRLCIVWQVVSDNADGAFMQFDSALQTQLLIKRLLEQPAVAEAVAEELLTILQPLLTSNSR